MPAASCLVIPVDSELRQRYIPSINISIRDLLSFKLPRLTTETSFFLSPEEPTCEAFDLLELGIPPKKQVDEFWSAIHATPSSTIVKSIGHQHSLHVRYPLCLAVLWKDLFPAISAQGLWLPVIEALRTGSQVIPDGLKETALRELDGIVWSGTVEGFGKVKGSIDDLSLWFTSEWLKTDHEEQMLQLLTSELQALPDGDFRKRTHIHGTHFFVLLKVAKEEGYSSQDVKRFSWLRHLGQSLQRSTCDRLASIVNISSNHWAAFVIDTKAAVVHYADGLHGLPPESLRESLDWWISQHFNTSFEWSTSTGMIQPDNHSCGILAYLNLCHWLMGHALPTATAESMANERIRMFLHIVSRHKKLVSECLEKLPVILD